MLWNAALYLLVCKSIENHLFRPIMQGNRNVLISEAQFCFFNSSNPLFDFHLCCTDFQGRDFVFPQYFITLSAIAHFTLTAYLYHSLLSNMA